MENFNQLIPIDEGKGKKKNNDLLADCRNYGQNSFKCNARYSQYPLTTGRKT